MAIPGVVVTAAEASVSGGPPFWITADGGGSWLLLLGFKLELSDLEMPLFSYPTPEPVDRSWSPALEKQTLSQSIMALPPQLHSFTRLEYSVLFSGTMTNMRVGIKFVIWVVSCKIATGQSKHFNISIKPVRSGSNLDCTNRPFQKAVSVLWLRSSQHLTDVLRQNQRND